MNLPPGFSLIDDDARSNAQGTTPAALPPGFSLIDEPRQEQQPQPEQREPSNYGFMDAVWGSLPFGDEVAGAAGAVARRLTGRADSLEEGYDQTVTQERSDRQRYAEENPGLSLAASGAAGLASLGTAGGAAAIPTGLVQTAVQGVKQGATIGGLFGAGEGEGIEDRLWEGAKGAGIGGTLGAVIPGVVAGGALAATAAKTVASPVTSAATNYIPRMAERRATKLVTEAFRRDGIPLDQAGARLTASRTQSPEMVLADMGGENVRGLTRATVNMPGSGRERVAAYMEARKLDQPQRVVEAVRSALKNPNDFSKTTARMAAERERIAAPIYQSAFRNPQPVDVSPVVRAIDARVMPGIHKMIGVGDLRPDGITATVGRLRSYFATAANQRTDLQQLHNIKMELDDLVSAAKRAGDTGKARAVMEVKTQLLRVMDKASPEYARARSIYSSSHEIDDALELGRSVLSSRMPADQLKVELASLKTPAEREMVQVGIARAIKDAADGTRDGRDLVKTLFGSTQVRNTLRAGFQNDQAFRKFQAQMVREAAMRRTNDAISGNSSTVKQFADVMEAGQDGIGRDVWGLLFQGRIAPAAAAAVRQALGRDAGISSQVADRMSRLLLSNDPAQIQRAMVSLSRREKTMERVRDALVKAGAAGGRFVSNESASILSSPSGANQ